MAIFYNKTQRPVNPGDAESAKKWYPRVKTLSLATEKEVARLISDETTLNPKEAEMALAQMSKVALNLLKSGRSVRLGDWGSISVTVSAKGADTEEDCGPKNITKVVPHVKFSKEFLASLQQATFQSVETMEKKVKTSTSGSQNGGQGSQGGNDDGGGDVNE